MSGLGTTEITQCDIKQNVTLNLKQKRFFIDYYDWSALSPDQLKKLPPEKTQIKGTVTISAVVTDSGKRQEMFGLNAKWLKYVVSFENSADSCEGKASIKMEQEGWFVDLVLEKDRCQVPQIPGQEGGCRPKMIIKSMQNPGFLLDGRTKLTANGKEGLNTKTETTALTMANLDQALFEIPKDFKEVDSLSELMQQTFDTSAKTIFQDDEKGKKAVKTVAIDFFSGNSSKVNQQELRLYISGKLTDAGMSGFPVNSQAEIAGGSFANIIGVEIKKIKESGASKIGGLFGKVTGNDDAAKIGESEAEIVITVYGKDGKTVVASAAASEKVKGKSNDAVKAAIDKIIGGLLEKIQ
jgi:hypothetical protein